MAKPKLVSKIRRSKAKAYTADWPSISKNVIARDGCCTKCGAVSSTNNKLRAHHIVPVSKGGLTVPFNLITLCDRCHAKQPGHKHLGRK